MGMNYPYRTKGATNRTSNRTNCRINIREILLMIITFIAVVAIVIIFSLWLIITLAMKPYLHKNIPQDDLKKYLETLLYKRILQNIKGSPDTKIYIFLNSEKTNT